MAMRKVGYARVSSARQVCENQVIALKQAGCDVVFTDDAISGTSTEREGLNDALATLCAGDVLVVWKLDRLARSLS
jgi:DNA invertase Pin-like site-specific DNA recombinase